VIILNLAPDKAIDYKNFNKLNDRTLMTGKWLEFCSACPVPEIANVFQRIGINFYQVTGYLKEDHVWKEIGEWIDAAKVKKIMSHNRVGLMGHYYNGMLDIYTDITNQIAHFGNHFEILEVDELSALRAQVQNDEIDKRVTLFYKTFDIQKDCSEEELRRSARTSVALDMLVVKYNLGSIAYYYKGTENSANNETISSIILGNSLLTEKGIPVAGEYEIKNVQAMKIMDSFGIGGSFTEYYAIDFEDDIVLMGHDGPGHIKISEGKTKVKPLQVYHGKVGNGLSVEMSVKHGPVTLLSVAESNAGKLKLVFAHGASVKGAVLEIGNTNSRYKFSIGAREFVESWNKSGAAHHCAIGIGHIGSKLEKLAQLLDMEAVQIC
jgi:L-arabinose isomerase